MNVLFVDDDPTLRRLSTFALEKFGDMTVVTAESGAEALRLVTESTPDVIVLDFHMPEMNGDEVLERLLDDPATSGIPVVFLTGIAPGKELDRLVELGAIGTIAKPFDPMTLPSQLESLVNADQRSGSPA